MLPSAVAAYSLHRQPFWYIVVLGNAVCNFVFFSILKIGYCLELFYSCREIGNSVQGSYGPTLCLASPVITFLLIGTLVTIDEPTLTCYY